MPKLKANQAFSLIELLVVISIIGLLSALVVANVSGVRDRARDAERKSDLNEIKKALRLYYNDYSRYPAASDNKINPSTVIEWGSAFTVGSMTYMNRLPSDPLPDQSYMYYQSSCTNGTDDYRLVTILENASDRDISSSHLRCPNNCGYTWNSTTNPSEYVVCAD